MKAPPTAHHINTHMHRPVNIACKHINFNYFLIWFTRTCTKLADLITVRCTVLHGEWRDDLDIQIYSLRHGLVYGLDAVAHGKLVHDFLLQLIEVNLPGIVSLSRWDFHHAASLHISQEVKDVLQWKMLSKSAVLKEVNNCWRKHLTYNK